MLSRNWLALASINLGKELHGLTNQKFVNLMNTAVRTRHRTMVMSCYYLSEIYKITLCHLVALPFNAGLKNSRINVLYNIVHIQILHSSPLTAKRNPV